MSKAIVFIKQMEKFYGRPLHPFSKYLLKKFEEYMQTPAEIQIKKGAAVTFEPYALPDFTEQFKVNSKKEIAFIHEDVGHMTGGRYYAYFVIAALMEVGYNVTVYTNRMPIFGKEFALYKKPKFSIISKTTTGLVDIDVKADAYMGSPINGNIAAIKLGKKYRKPAFAMVFDPFNMMAEFIGTRQYKGWEKLIPMLKQPDTKIISLCNTTSKYIHSWIDKDPASVYPIYPCINSKVLNGTERVIKRGDYVLFISRLVGHKRFEDVLQAVRRTKLRLKVISSINGIKAQLVTRKYGMQSRVDFHLNVSDSEKFDMIFNAKAVVNGSIFEGFGMYVAEAIACGVPFVGYDYPTFREIRDFAGAKNIYLAKHKNIPDLRAKLQLAIDEGNYQPPSNAFNFEAMVARVAEKDITDAIHG